MDNSAELEQIANARKAGRKVVFTNGCFDIIHVGHVRYLTDARALGDLLVIGLNSDASVQRLKGPTRPIVSETERKEVLLGLKAVDCVCMFDEDTPLELIKQVAPDVLVKGGDWTVDKIVGADFVFGRGGNVLSLKFQEGHSTTDIVEKILATKPS